MYNPKAKPEARQKAVAEFVATLNQDQAPILLGPWRSELGFEVSYWTPFLRFLGTKVKHFDKRSAVVTRGGLAPLYGDVAGGGFDLYALRTVADVRRENRYDYEVRHAGKTVKQLESTDWDEAVLADAAAALGIPRPYHVVHPALMYWALEPYWKELRGIDYLSSMTDYAPLPRINVTSALPPVYVAVKFYGRATFPYPHPDIARYVTETVAKIAQCVPVVSLSAGNDYDDHVDIPIVGQNILTLPADLPTEENLKAQAAVISHATAFVGTYGGSAQLALRMGVPSYSVYASWQGTAHQHYALSSWLSKAFTVPFVVQSVAEGGTDAPGVFVSQMVKAGQKGLAVA